ncbi:MAG: hypothetical protein KGY45_05055, partial [Hadesarchaea archaeon]|nr:hypothetical protein [Hadesarchaea archaeon]
RGNAVNACFGTLANRTLARFLARSASEELGESVAISVDPYRILLRSERLAVEEVETILKGELGGNLREKLEAIIEDSRFFKWRIVQIARRMGSLKHETEMTSGVVDKLIKGLKDTPVYQEAFKEVVRKDLDLPQALEILNKIKSGEIKVNTLGFREEPSPITGIAWEERALNFEPVSPKRMNMLILASTRARLLSEERTFACTECKDWVEVKPLHKLSDEPTCSNCGSESIGMIEEEAREVQRILNRVKKTSKQGKKSDVWRELNKTSKLISNYGKPAAAALAGRGLKVDSAKKILEEEQEITDRFLELVMREEKRSLLHKYT